MSLKRVNSYYVLGALASLHSGYKYPREAMLSYCTLSEVFHYFEDFLNGWCAGGFQCINGEYYV